jgi:hypothetical protein
MTVSYPRKLQKQFLEENDGTLVTLDVRLPAWRGGEKRTLQAICSDTISKLVLELMNLLGEIEILSNDDEEKQDQTECP